MRIQHNIMAMNAYRNYGNNTSALSKNLEKLSSGYRINRAGDDAAGLAISEKMRAQIQGLNAAQKNVKDAISFVKTAEGAMQEIQDMLSRMKYLATQSANGTYEDAIDRNALQDEVNSLLEEINRIAKSANFNDIHMLTGPDGDSSIDPLEATLGGTDGAGIGSVVLAFADGIEDDAKTKLNETLSGVEFDVVVAEDGTSNTGTVGEGDTVKIQGLYDALDGAGYTMKIGENAVSSDTLTVDTDVAAGAEIVIDIYDGDNKVGSVTIGAPTKEGTTSVTFAEAADETDDEDAANYGAVFESADLTALGASNDFSIKGLTEDITSIKFEVVTGSIGEGAGISAAESGGVLTITMRLTHSSQPTNTFANMGDVAGAIQTAIRTVSGLENATVSGTITGATLDGKSAGTTLATLNVEEIEDEDGDGDGTGKGDLNKPLDLTTNKARLDSYKKNTYDIQMQIGDSSNDYDKMTMSIRAMTTESLGLTIGDSTKLQISNVDSANTAIDIIKNAINIVSSVRGNLGAYQNRLEHTQNNLSVMTENIQDAESTIRDTDVAEEMMAYTKNNILIQSAQAMLAQANAVPQGVLQLLG